jgi:hypothetical protein
LYQRYNSSGAAIVCTSRITHLSSNDDLLCFGTLEITDRDFGLWRQTWLFLILLPPIAFATKRFSFVLLTVRVAQASNEDHTRPIPATGTLLLPLPSTLARTMMIPHWAPTIHDGYAHHGRPQKPRRLIHAPHLVFANNSPRALLTHSSCG